MGTQVHQMCSFSSHLLSQHHFTQVSDSVHSQMEAELYHLAKESRKAFVAQCLNGDRVCDDRDFQG